MKKDKNQALCSTDLKEGPVESQLVLPSSKLNDATTWLIHRYAQFKFFRKGSATSFPTTFYVGFFKKNVSRVVFY